MRHDHPRHTARCIVFTARFVRLQQLATEHLPEGRVGEAADATDAGRDLWNAMERLPRRQRAVVVLRYFEDLTEVQTAAAMGISSGAVKSMTRQALGRLRVLAPELADLVGADS